ncbi:heterokaryon incompatibility protein-domain-containing protein [Pyrenochaeta sp. MPI-SDFR-AT-0127]|nr:heterokaryon incompatibility protein-domain-containing protein [Pyrenochaeta sp. MPI-SDFR-AT-0127]
MEAFKYNHTLQGRNIRLLKVIPGAESTVLRIELMERSLDDAQFEALSYVWGDQKEKMLAICNSKQLEIGANLYAALLQKRRRRCTVPIWADQICIDQNNTDEKTRQVRLMRTIYATADRVVIWLGEQQSEDEDAYSLAKHLYRKFDGRSYDINAGKYDFHDFDCRSVGVPEPLFNWRWTAFFNIISNPWFGRVWVVQELLVAKKSVMWRGRLDLDTDVILWLAMQVGRHRNLYCNFNNTMGSPEFSALTARDIASGYYAFKDHGPRPIYGVLSRYLGMEATDSRDRFFALAGVSLGLDPAFVDYKKTFREVACLVGKMTLLGFPTYRVTGNGTELLILNDNPSNHRFLIDWLAFHANPKNIELGLPSWVPDLLSPHKPGLLMTGFYNSLYLQTERPLPNPRVRFSDQPVDITGVGPTQWQIRVPNVSRTYPFPLTP